MTNLVNRMEALAQRWDGEADNQAARRTVVAPWMSPALRTVARELRDELTQEENPDLAKAAQVEKPAPQVEGQTALFDVDGLP